MTVAANTAISRRASAPCDWVTLPPLVQSFNPASPKRTFPAPWKCRTRHICKPVSVRWLHQPRWGFLRADASWAELTADCQEGALCLLHPLGEPIFQG